MRTILYLILYSFSFCIAKGQNGFTVPDSVIHFIEDSNIVLVNPYYGIRTAHYFPKTDTLKVLFLYSDTTDQSYISINNHQYEAPDFHTYWQIGFKVYDYTNNEIIYLDEQKNKLPKSIVVWQDIEQEN